MRCRLIAVLLGSWLAGSAMVAWAQVLPYESYPCQDYPSLETRQLSLREGPFPDADPQVMELASYSQLETFSGEVGVVALRTQVDTFAAVMHYSPAGVTYVSQPGISLPYNHQLCLSFYLPPKQTAGVTRVVVWREAPNPKWIEMLATHPNFLAEEVPGLLSQRWFSRVASVYYQAPWEDPLRPHASRPFGFGTQWPYAQAELNVNELIRAKDCVVTHTGNTSSANDTYGVYGRWDFYWGSELRLAFYLPSALHYGRAQLHLIGEPPDSMSIGGASVLEVYANGWTVLESVYGLPLDDGRELFVYPLSQYLEGGANEIVLTLDSFSGSKWMLDRIELWIE